MARGDHPKRTPFYGALMLFAAFMGTWLAASVHIVWLSVAIYILAAIVAAAGCLMTFRDYSF